MMLRSYNVSIGSGCLCECGVAISGDEVHNQSAVSGWFLSLGQVSYQPSANKPRTHTEQNQYTHSYTQQLKSHSPQSALMRTPSHWKLLKEDGTAGNRWTG